MMIRHNLRAPLLAGAVAAAVAATAWANSEDDYYSSTSLESVAVAETTTVAVSEPLAPAEPLTSIALVEEPIAASESLLPNETVVVAEDATLVKKSEREPIRIEERRLSRDESIQLKVMDVLGTQGNLSGKIGVESHDAVVTLTGYTTTSGQRDRAGRYAGNVEGVRYVVNEIRPRIGAITS